MGTISVILVALAIGQTGACPSGVMSIAKPNTEDSIPESKRGRVEVRPALSFSDEDKVGT